MRRAAEIGRIGTALLLAAIFSAGCGEDSQTVAGAGGSPSGPTDKFPPDSVATATPDQSLSPAPSWTPLPVVTPGNVDLSGDWTITVPTLGVVCPAFVAQVGANVELDLTCLGLTAKLTGSVDASGKFSATGAAPSLCPTLGVTGTVSAGGDTLSGDAYCAGQAVPFEGHRGAPPLTPTPVAMLTPKPAGTPGGFDLTGEWTISVPMLGASCPATVVQVGNTLEIDTPCAGVQVKLTGEIGESGDLFATGSAPSLCSTLTLTGTITDGGNAIDGNATCDGLQFTFEGMRRSAPDGASPTDYLLPLVRTTESTD